MSFYTNLVINSVVRSSDLMAGETSLLSGKIISYICPSLHCIMELDIIDVESSAHQNFVDYIRNPKTLKKYESDLKRFLDLIPSKIYQENKQTGDLQKAIINVADIELKENIIEPLKSHSISHSSEIIVNSLWNSFKEEENTPSKLYLERIARKAMIETMQYYLEKVI